MEESSFGAADADGTAARTAVVGSSDRDWSGSVDSCADAADAYQLGGSSTGAVDSTRSVDRPNVFAPSAAVVGRILLLSSRPMCS